MTDPTTEDERDRLFSDLLNDCVHCGFCLPTCPTHVLWGQEMDSPRGRIHLMAQTHDEDVLTEAAVGHFDNCLGCLACVSACPSGVAYDALIDSTRHRVEREHERPAGERALRGAIFALFPYRRRLGLLRGPLRAYQASGVSSLVRRTGLLERVSPALATMERISPPLSSPPPALPELVPAVGRARARVGMLVGCVQGAFFPEVNTATARVLALEGCDVVIPRAQGCCGALSGHAGRMEESADLARSLIEVFERERVDRIVVNSAGCGSSMKHFDRTLAEAGADRAWVSRGRAQAERVADLTEFLVELGPRAERHPLPLHVAYHDACHLSHGQGVTRPPRALLAGIPELRVSDLPNGEICCGSAGVYNLLKPEAARELGDRKGRDVASTGADVLVSGNPGCSLQIASAMDRAGSPVAVTHTARVLDASLRGLTVARLLGRR
ncbi:(Fe-S)-binding protein [Nocardiopsis sp. HUAS JQ3]|uniref:(Fe-S)-binding protein n=1 Tax=Nocardiopsis sp. HUAS JQ3 TaxID=3061629 RepID=UPI0023A96735|nr:heterodisulfide reductase-related iron-sulfur binding cluster [Nocardiopsis sp. HUAS JQ3]WDZ92378.1 heterodisulfide reductase-related iron-sulfur binding cluster [Nocardiopsis sp. HUAS JQ3]